MTTSYWPRTESRGIRWLRNNDWPLWMSSEQSKWWVDERSFVLEPKMGNWRIYTKLIVMNLHLASPFYPYCFKSNRIERFIYGHSPEVRIDGNTTFSMLISPDIRELSVVRGKISIYITQRLNLILVQTDFDAFERHYYTKQPLRQGFGCTWRLQLFKTDPSFARLIPGYSRS